MPIQTSYAAQPHSTLRRNIENSTARRSPIDLRLIINITRTEDGVATHSRMNVKVDARDLRRARTSEGGGAFRVECYLDGEVDRNPLFFQPSRQHQQLVYASTTASLAEHIENARLENGNDINLRQEVTAFKQEMAATFLEDLNNDLEDLSLRNERDGLDLSAQDEVNDASDIEALSLTIKAIGNIARAVVTVDAISNSFVRQYQQHQAA